MDKSTDVDIKAVILIFLRYTWMDVNEDLLCALFLPTNHYSRRTSKLWIITYQENWIGPFVSASARIELLPWLDSFLDGKDGYAKRYYWPECLKFESCCKDFFQKKTPLLARHFCDKEWITKLAYLCDVLNLLDKLKLHSSLQRTITTVFTLAELETFLNLKNVLFDQAYSQSWLSWLYHLLAMCY